MQYPEARQPTPEMVISTSFLIFSYAYCAYLMLSSCATLNVFWRALGASEGLILKMALNFSDKKAPGPKS